MEEDLREFLCSRGLDEETISVMKENKIDKAVIQAVDDDTLSKYVPKQGDRIAIKQFCCGRKSGDQKKLSLLESLRRKLRQGNSEETYPKRTKHLSGNKNARKTTRKVELGWLNFDNGLKQVRSKSGGGTRKLDMEKSWKKDQVLHYACALFFPNDMSKLGPLEDFDVHLCDFSYERWDTDETVGDLYERSGIALLRFFLATTRKNDHHSGHDKGVSDVVTEPTNTPKNSYTCTAQSSTLTTKQSFLPFGQNESSSKFSSLLSWSQTASSPGSSPLPDMRGDVFGDILLSDDIDIGAEIIFPKEPLLKIDTLHYQEEDVSFNVPLEELMDAGIVITERKEDDESTQAGDTNGTTASNSDAQPGSSGSHDHTFAEPFINETESARSMDSVFMTVHRGSSGFHEVIGYFKDPDICNKIIMVSRILPNGDKELAEDSGGVMRDLLSEFWDSFYEMCTVGRDVKVPTLRHDIGPVEWQAIGRILVYGYRVTGYWPIKLAKSFVLSTISAEDVGTEDLLQDFWNYAAVSDKDIFQDACKEYDSVPYEELLESLDSYDCRTAPNENNIKPILLEIAHTQLIQKPTFVSNCMREELIKTNIENRKVEEIYEKIQPTCRKVIGLLRFPDNMNEMQLEVTRHLKRYIKDMDKEKLGLFLRFCTGSDLLTVDKISVEFSSLVGAQRRPIAHTCGCVLELPKMYESFVEFRFEFDSIFRHNIWVMDSI